MRRIPSCIGLDAENKEYLDSREESNAEIINSLIKAYREQEGVRNSVGELKPSSVSPEIMESIKGTLKPDNKEHLIREYLRETPGKVYAVKLKEDLVDRGFLLNLAQKIAFKKKVEFSIAQIRSVLRDEVDSFDVEAYLKKEKERHDYKR